MGEDRGESAIKALHRAATSMQSEETIEGVCERTVETAADILDFSKCTVVIREGEWLVPYAISTELPATDASRMRIDEGQVGRAYRTGVTQVDDNFEDPDADPETDRYPSAISVAIGEHGVFQAASTATAAFDDDDVELAELLVSHTETALDRIERESELQRQIERLDQFASVVSHDLRSPLNVAAGRLTLAAEECDSSHLEDVADAHERMERLIEDLLTFARAGTEAIDPTTVELSELIEECWDTISDGEATLVVDTEHVIQADRDRLRQLLVNLLTNALDHGGTGVTITVGDLRRGFYFEDDGPGIPAGEHTEILEAGYTTSEDGTGFGLSIVKQVAEAHGWEVHVTDGTDGGARFEFTDVEFAE